MESKRAMKATKIDIPEGVVDVDQYKKYLAFSRHPILQNKEYLTSDGRKLSISMQVKNFLAKIDNLPPKEREALTQAKELYMSIAGKRNMAKARAFGRYGRPSEYKPRKDGGLPMKIRTKKLSAVEEDIVELLGRMFTVPEVVKIMREEAKEDIDEDDVKLILKRYITEIERKREEFKNKLTDVRLYNKRPRLEELAWMYSKARERWMALGTNDYYMSMLRTLEQIRKESEGDVININGALDVNIEMTIQAQLQKEALKTINLKEVIIGRVCARMGFDPAKMIASLHNSYYARFVTISGDFDPDARMVHPSTMVYDFAKIEQSTDIEAKQDISAEPITEEEKSDASLIKDMFLAKLKKAKQEDEHRQNAMDVMGSSNLTDERVKRQIVKRGKGRPKGVGK